MQMVGCFTMWMLTALRIRAAPALAGQVSVRAGAQAAAEQLVQRGARGRGVP